MEISGSRWHAPTDHDLPFSTWSLAKLADFLVADRVEDISHEGLRSLPYAALSNEQTLPDTALGLEVCSAMPVENDLLGVSELGVVQHSFRTKGGEVR